MGKKKKLGKYRQDKYYHLAREQGLRSRAAFKLIQLNQKYDFLGKSRALLDLCAAPGGWCQVAAQYMPMNSLIIGVDLLPIQSIPHVITLQDDITTQSCRHKLKRESKGWKMDAVIMDGAPNVGGATWYKDAYMQNELVLHALKLASEFLTKGGIFIAKVFRSKEYNLLLWVIKQFFESTEITKPLASRNSSAEIYIVGQGFLAPKTVDPKLFDPAHVFSTVEEPEKPIDVLSVKETKKKRHRSGYEDGVTLLYKELPAARFVESAEPIPLLGQYNAFTFKDADSLVYKQHKATVDEVLHLCEDLKVLSKGDFRRLLKWRDSMRQYRTELLEEKAKSGDEEEEEEESDKEKAPVLTPAELAAKEDAAIDAELSNLTEKARKELRKARKKKREQRMRQRKRLALSGMGQSQGDAGIQDNADEQGLFSLNKIKEVEVLDDVQGTDELGPPSSSSSDEMSSADDEAEPESDEDNAGYTARDRAREQELNQQYEDYKQRRKIVTKRDRQRTRKMGLVDEQKEDESLEALAREVAQSQSGVPSLAPEPAPTNPLLVSLGMENTDTVSAAEKAKRWFSRDVFQALETDPAAVANAVDDDASDVDTDDDLQTKVPRSASSTQKATANNGASYPGTKPSLADLSSASEDEDDDQDTRPHKHKSAGDNDEEDDFEIVPMEDMSDDSDARAETMALGQLMLRKKTKNDLIDSGYNRYAWNDDELPEWFIEDEEKHNKASLPVTKAEVMAYKQELKAINARPIKKVREANARKRKRAEKTLEKVRAEANLIAAQSGLSAGEKTRAIAKLYARAKKPKREAPTIVVSQKSGGKRQLAAREARGVRRNFKLVDKRMKSDTRGLERAERKKRKGKGGSRKRGSKSSKKNRR